eukprot:2362511-Pyramimonas_sp.AAC.1
MAPRGQGEEWHRDLSLAPRFSLRSSAMPCQAAALASSRANQPGRQRSSRHWERLRIHVGSRPPQRPRL